MKQPAAPLTELLQLRLPVSTKRRLRALAFARRQAGADELVDMTSIVDDVLDAFLTAVAQVDGLPADDPYVAQTFGILFADLYTRLSQ